MLRRQEVESRLAETRYRHHGSIAPIRRVAQLMRGLAAEIHLDALAMDEQDAVQYPVKNGSSEEGSDFSLPPGWDARRYFSEEFHPS